jgi:hypothetical protein
LATERAPVVNSDEQLLSILDSLRRCEARLRECGCDDTAHLVSVAILELQMRIHGISDADLRALCDQMLPESDVSAHEAREAKSSSASRRRPLLRLVK